MSTAQIVWFKRDLRIADHAPLAAAAAHGPVVPLYIVEPELWAQPDASARQWSFARECLLELASDLEKLGVPLCIRVGSAVDVLDQLATETGAMAVWSHEETGNGWTYARDRAVQAWARAGAITWTEIPQTGVIRAIKTRAGWARRWGERMASAPLPAPAAIQPVAISPSGRTLPEPCGLKLPPDPCPARQTGGRSVGLATLESFLAGRGRTYRTAMSSPVAGETGCSRISPYLAFGAISMREVHHATQTARSEARDSTWRGALSSFSGRLHWHCHFMQKLEDAPRLETEEMHRAYSGLRPLPGDPAMLQAWATGQTGWPFVDACMRSLQATGWLNFRMRAMVMAVASYHLWLPWQETGLVLARLFTDYEPGIHWPQVQMQSGTTGINTVRIYNPVKQGHDQDPDGQFVRRWVPELASVPDAFVHEPWRWEGSTGLAYPPPVVDHLAAARQARDLVWSLRSGPAFKAEADWIQSRHGSRKSGVSSRRAGKPARSPAPSPQLDLFDL